MLRYLLVFLYVTACSLATDQSDTTLTVIPASGKSMCANGQNLTPLQQLLCMSGQNLTPAQQVIYVYGSQDWKAPSNSVNLLEKAGSDYLVTSGMGAHKLHTRKLPWNKARRICIQEGGHLAVINSNSEEKLLLRILDEYKLNFAWLGVHDLYEEGDWNTITDEPLESTGYSKWSTKISNLPDNAGNRQHCGILMKEGGMDDIDCTQAQPFFCEIRA